MLSSLCHIEMTPCDVGRNDRLLVQSVLKGTSIDFLNHHNLLVKRDTPEMAQTSNIDTARQKNFKGKIHHHIYSK